LGWQPAQGSVRAWPALEPMPATMLAERPVQVALAQPVSAQPARLVSADSAPATAQLAAMRAEQRRQEPEPPLSEAWRARP
jgi:hypothetical protein